MRRSGSLRHESGDVHALWSSCKARVGNVKKTRFRIVACIVAIAGLVVVSACSERQPLRLSASDDEANRHFVAALTLRNENTEYLNRLGGNGSVPKVGTFDMKELRLQVDKLTTCLSEAEQVSPDFLFRVHRDLPAMWQNVFVPAVRQRRDYYGSGIDRPSEQLPPERLVEAQALMDRWGNWYEANREAIRSGIRQMAR